MGCNLKDFSSYLQELLQVEAFEDMAVNGIQVAGKEKILHIASAVTASLNIIQKAAKAKADLLLVHHGLFLKGKEMRVVGTLKNKLKVLLEQDMSLCAYHLPLDAHVEFGNNWQAAKALGWTSLEPFGYYQGTPIGVKGSFAPCSRQEFQKRLEDFYKVSAHAAPGGPATVRSAALVSGGAHKLIYEAKASGVDCYVTGSFDEPIWHAAFEEQINFFALGHAATEKIGVELLGKQLATHFNLQHTFLDEPNPF